MKKERVLFFGPYPDPITGQSIAFKQAFDGYFDKKLLFDSAKFKNSKVLNTIYCISFLPLIFLFYRFNKIYFTCSRSKLGFIKDAQLLLLSRIFKKKVINHLHGADFLDFYNNSGFLKKIIYWSYKKVDINIVLLKSMEEQFLNFNHKNLEVVSNSYSKEFEDYQVSFLNKKMEIVYLSNLLYTKGIIYFMMAAEEILKINKDVVFKVAGLPMEDIEMSKKELEQKFKEIKDRLEHKYPNRFKYLGLVRGLEKINLLQESSIFVLPTFYKTEAFPLTIIEAMYFGNAVITTDHNYLGDVVGKENGFLVKPRDVESIVKNIMALINDNKLCTSIQKNNHHEAKSKYNPTKFSSSINKIILES